MTVILLRHGRSTSNVAHTLAGRSPGVELDEKGQRQAQQIADRLASVGIREIVCSPMMRCAQTIAPLAATLGLTAVTEDRLAEVDYGQWTGRHIGELVSEPLWKVVQQQPSAAYFPGGEGLAQVQTRSVAAIREYDRRLSEQHGDCVWLACTHGDVIKSVLADALGIHLDGFQRIVVDPASVSVVRYTDQRPFVVHLNHTGADLSSMLSAAPPEKPSDDAVVGGTTD